MRAVIGLFTDDCQNRDPPLGGPCGHATYHLPLEALVVEATLAGDDQVDVHESFVQFDLLGDEFETGADLPAGDHQTTGQATGRPGSGPGRNVHAMVLPVDLGESLQPSGQQSHLGGRRTLLRGEDRRGFQEGRPNVTRNDEIDPLQPAERVQRPERRESAIGRRGSTEPDDDSLRSRVDGGRDQLAGPGRARRQGIVAIGPADEVEPGGGRHLDDGHAAPKPPRSVDRIAERARDSGDPVGSTQGIERPFSAIGQWSHPDGGTGGFGPVSEGARHLGRARGPAELVGSDQHLHHSILPYDPAVADRPVLIVSNRGPLSFRRDDVGELIAKRGGGGLVSGLGPVVERTGALWIAAALSDDDREAVRSGLVERQDGPPVRLVDLDPTDHAMAYDVVSNAVLWFMHHHLWDLARLPRFDRHFSEAWEAYRRVNQHFATVVAEQAEPGAIVLVQDLHLTIVGRYLAEERPDLKTVHFSHTPFGAPEMVDVLPDRFSTDLIDAMASHTAVGFHSARWEDSFRRAALARSIDPGRTFVAPLPTDADDIRRVAASQACQEALRSLDATLGTRRVIARVDRIELSKNLLRGFHAFDALLRDHPALRGDVVFVASVYPSREGLADYLAYRREVEGIVDRINARWGTEDWTPVELDTSDDFARSVAVLRRYDVLLVNPIRDGLNLVAKEGPIVNDRAGTVLLSRQAGVWDELAEHVTEVHPYDIDGTATAMADALATPDESRRQVATRLREAATTRTPSDWLEDQLRSVS